MQVRRGLVQQRVQGLHVHRAVVAADGQDDLAAGGEGLGVEQLAEAALLGGHDPAGRVGAVDFPRPSRLRARGRLRVLQRFAGPAAAARASRTSRQASGGSGRRPSGCLRDPAAAFAAARRSQSATLACAFACSSAARASSRWFSAASFAVFSARSASARSRRACSSAASFACAACRRASTCAVRFRPVPGPAVPAGGPAAPPSPHRASSASSAARASVIQASTSAAISFSSSAMPIWSCSAVTFAAIEAFALTFVPSPATTSTRTRPSFAHATSDCTSRPRTGCS